MNAKEQLIAYCATLFAIVVLVIAGLAAAWNGKNIEAVGVAAAITGLIGLIKFPSNNNAVAKTDSGDVNVNQPSKQEN